MGNIYEVSICVLDIVNPEIVELHDVVAGMRYDVAVDEGVIPLQSLIEGATGK